MKENPVASGSVVPERPALLLSLLGDRESALWGFFNGDYALVLGNESSRSFPIECVAMTAKLANEDRVEWRLALEPPVARADLEDYLAGLARSLSTEITSAEVVDGAQVLEGHTDGIQDAIDRLFSSRVVGYPLPRKLEARGEPA